MPLAESTSSCLSSGVSPLELLPFDGLLFKKKIVLKYFLGKQKLKKIDYIRGVEGGVLIESSVSVVFAVVFACTGPLLKKVKKNRVNNHSKKML